MERRHGSSEQGTRPRAGSEKRQERRGGLEGWRAGGLKALVVEKQMVVCDMQRAGAKKANHQVDGQASSRAVLLQTRYPSGKLPQNEAELCICLYRYLRVSSKCSVGQWAGGSLFPAGPLAPVSGVQVRPAMLPCCPDV